ncbi:hypothetical protein Gobs01_02644 [Geodermatophilus obscurus DSM 43160]
MAAAGCAATLLWTQVASPMSNRPGSEDAPPGDARLRVAAPEAVLVGMAPLDGGLTEVFGGRTGHWGPIPVTRSMY